MYLQYINHAQFKHEHAIFFTKTYKTDIVFNSQNILILMKIFQQNTTYIFNKHFNSIFFKHDIETLFDSKIFSQNMQLQNMTVNLKIFAIQLNTFFYSIQSTNSNLIIKTILFKSAYVYCLNRFKYVTRCFILFKRFMQFSKRSFKKTQFNFHMKQGLKKFIKNKKKLRFMRFYNKILMKRLIKMKKRNILKGKTILKRAPTPIRNSEVNTYFLFTKLLNLNYKDFTMHLKTKMQIANKNWSWCNIYFKIGDLTYVNAANLFLWYVDACFKQYTFSDVDTLHKYTKYVFYKNHAFDELLLKNIFLKYRFARQIRNMARY